MAHVHKWGATGAGVSWLDTKGSNCKQSASTRTAGAQVLANQRAPLREGSRSDSNLDVIKMIAQTPQDQLRALWAEPTGADCPVFPVVSQMPTRCATPQHDLVITAK